MADKSKSLKDNFVSKVVTDPNNVPDTLLLSGYMGASSLPNHTRLYFDAQLSSYVEIPDDAILHTQDQPAESSPLGGSFVWIKKDAILTHKTGADKTKAKFLEGPIVQQFAAAAAPAAQPQGITIPGCQPSLIPAVCPTHTPACVPTTPAHCATQVMVLCPTHTPACAPSSPLICPTHTLSCAPSTPLVCATHTPVCFPTVVNQVCVTQTPLCITHSPVCVTQIPVCQVTFNPVICGGQTIINCPTHPACPTIAGCPTLGACPTIACGFPGGGGNPVA